MTHFARIICISIAIKIYIYMLACLLNLLAMASVNVCRLCTNMTVPGKRAHVPQIMIFLYRRL